MKNHAVHDCSLLGSQGMSIPTIEEIAYIDIADAKFILVVEKEATFQSLCAFKWIESVKAILITGKGYPDVNTRVLVNFLSKMKADCSYLTGDVPAEGFFIESTDQVVADADRVDFCESPQTAGQEDFSMEMEGSACSLFELLHDHEHLTPVKDKSDPIEAAVPVRDFLRVFVLTDCDPHGINIALTYQIGSRVCSTPLVIW